MKQFVLIALRKPYTFVVLAILILVFGALAAEEAPTDVFPVMQIPVSSIVGIYDKLMPQDVEGRITYVFERLMTQTVEGIKYIWSNSLFGNAIINVYLQERFSIFRHTPRWLDRIFDLPGLLRTVGKRQGKANPDVIGRMTCSTTTPFVRSSSKSPGVAETKNTCRM